MPVERTTERLRRILVLVPWVMANPGASLDELCERFGTTRDELAADLDMVFCCGLPPFGPGDLINVSIEQDRVLIDTADYMKRPPRLTRTEAITLLVMGRAIARLPGFEEAESLRSALRKLESATEARDAIERIEVELSPAGAELLAGLRAAADERARIHVVYFSAGRGELSERDVDPLLVFFSAANSYLAAFDHRSGEERLFRIDRIKEWRRTGDVFTPPSGFDSSRYARDGALFTPSARDVVAQIDVAPSAAWMREFIPHERATEQGRGWIRLHVRTPHLGWLVRLLLGAGNGSARAVEPPELRQGVRDAARRALDLYGA